MTGKRRVGLGSVVVKQSGGGGAATAFKQGGGNKLIGLISTRNMAINGAMVRYIRTRSDGGNSRNWIFCMNQLGGVGRRWGQAAGPGNRAGVSAGCAELARQSRLDHLLGWHGGGGGGGGGRPIPNHMNATRAISALRAYMNGDSGTRLPRTITASAASSFNPGLPKNHVPVSWDRQVMSTSTPRHGAPLTFTGSTKCGAVKPFPPFLKLDSPKDGEVSARGCRQNEFSPTTFEHVNFGSYSITLGRGFKEFGKHYQETTIITIYDATF